MYDLAVIVARMQPMHLEHENLIKTALSKAHKVLLLLGSDGAAPSLRNPFSVSQRAAMVRLRFPTEHLMIEGLRDMSYQNHLWVQEVKSKIEKHGADSIVMFRGGRGDSENIKSDFPEYHHEVFEVTKAISGTAIREQFFEGNYVEGVSEEIREELEAFNSTSQYHVLKAEYKAAKAYRESWSNSPFPPIFMAADNLVTWYRTSISKPRVLLIERKSEFGNGKWALAGGYVEVDQTLIEAARAELEEETSLDTSLIPYDKPPVIFDAINRSARGRMLTALFHNEIHQDTEPFVEGGDDAARAFWIPLMELRLHERRMFSDHYHLIGKIYPEIYHV